MSQRAAIEAKIRGAFAPTHLEVIDESSMHSVPQGSESHFRLLIVSDWFEGRSQIDRHRAVYEILADEMSDLIHALGLQTMTSSEWAHGSIAQSPGCLGGSKATQA
ncbi:MAG: BolA family protein [Acidobacteriota bacterium]